MTSELETGDICNEHGDILFKRNCPPIMEGRLCLSFSQAFAALQHGWRWVEADDGDNIHVQRGQFAWKARP